MFFVFWLQPVLEPRYQTTLHEGRLQSVDWTHWTGMVDWNGGLEWWTGTVDSDLETEDAVTDVPRSRST